ncbi:MAG: tRNA (adenosine(37)-N6)-dimethylallyltransferase MiaA [Porphyromonadaceae bacterium]|nr:tRNA (adenosine(37)-N6)-dimethylallyltransferase MiaA [Porphyromonadaceae bacterium]
MGKLIVLLGPTGVGKTELSLRLATHLAAPIVSADSRQVYREIPIGTAAPNSEALGVAEHFLVGARSIHQPYSASLYEQEALALIDQLFQSHEHIILSGGSMMYIDAVCHGIDDIPDVSAEVRRSVYERHEREGLEPILQELRELDPEYYDRVDKQNYKRVLHGLEVCLSSGRPFSSFHTGQRRERPFKVIKIGINRPREELYERINLRVEQMFALGLEQEARAVYPYRQLNALNTVGYKELFAYFDGTISLDEAKRQIQRNSRIYSRKQLTWWQRDGEIKWFAPYELDGIISYVKSSCLP